MNSISKNEMNIRISLCNVRRVNGMLDISLKIVPKKTHQGRCLLIPKYFCAVYDYARKADLSKAYWNPKRKLGVTMHFSEIIKQ